MKNEVVIPKLLEDNKADWVEEDVLQRVLQLVQYVTSRKLDILQTLTSPKCSITIAKVIPLVLPLCFLSLTKIRLNRFRIRFTGLANCASTKRRRSSAKMLQTLRRSFRPLRETLRLWRALPLLPSLRPRRPRAA